MSSIAISSIVFACVFASALIGMALRSALPESHRNSESKSVVQLGMGLIVTLVAMVLGLLVASAKGYYDMQTTELTELSTNVVLLDRVLAHYGSETEEVRKTLRGAVVEVLDQVWPNASSGQSLSNAKNDAPESLYDKVQQLSPKDDEQRQLKSQALSILTGLGHLRWLMYEQKSHSPTMLVIAVLVFWLMAIFISFGLFAPPNATVVVSLLVSALSVSGAILLMLEMYRPYAGLIHISDAPLRAALAHLGQ